MLPNNAKERAGLTRDSIKLPFWELTAEETAQALLADSKQGLTSKEVSKRRECFGLNVIRADTRLLKLAIFLNQWKSPLIIILLVAGLATVFLQEWIDALVIWAAVFVNTGLGFYQEHKAETALAELQTYIRTRVRVRRSRMDAEIDAEELVPGDIMRLSQGDRAPADARIIFANNFETDEAILTGESLPEAKMSEAVAVNTPLADRTSMIYGGTLVVRGIAEVVVTATGEDTEFGKIAALVRSGERTETPLQKNMTYFASRSAMILGSLVVILFFVGLAVGHDIFEMFLIAVAVAVSAVPEGLPIALTVILAVGVLRLAKKKGIVRRLLAAETLGTVSLILTDKTGTLTEARMELEKVIPWGESKERMILEHALSTIDIVIENPNDHPAEWRVVGHPIEQGLVRGAVKYGVEYPKLFGREFRDRLPFNSEYKFAAAVQAVGQGSLLMMVGAPEIILKFSDASLEVQNKIMAVIQEKAAEGKRLIGIASRIFNQADYKIPQARNFEALRFEGLLVFHDPLRPTVKDAISRIGKAGIRTVIVTGDHKGTAEAIAREVGIWDGGIALTGDDLKYLSPEELFNRAKDISVFARVVPEDKLRLVRMFRARGEVVAVTGDGVNDAPALKEADIGVSLGSGTDVARGAADLVLLDDNFETLVLAIEEGRRILQNIRKASVYLLSDSLDELFLIGGALIFGLPLPLNALQILFVNFFSDSFPALAFAFENGIDDHLAGRIRKKSSLFDREMKVYILGIGVGSSALLFFIYAALLRYGFPEDLVKTFIFATFSSYTLFVAFALRSFRKSIFEYNPFSNKLLTAGVSVGLLLTAAAIYVPFLQRVFGTVALPLSWLGWVGVVGILNLAAAEVCKLYFRRYD